MLRVRGEKGRGRRSRDRDLATNDIPSRGMMTDDTADLARSTALRGMSMCRPRNRARARQWLPNHLAFFFSYRTTIPLRTTRDMVLHAREEKREESRRALAAATILSSFELEFFPDFGLRFLVSV